MQGLGEGTYSVKITAKGFQSYLAENQVMRVGQNIRVDATLSVGSSTTEVTVQGSSAGTVETQSSELSTTITSKQITQLELNGRSFTQLIELSPGVSNQTGTTDPVNGPGQGVAYSVNGGRTEYNNWEIDGGDVLDSGSMSNLNVLPNVDALDQVQVFTSSYDAQYGRSGSGAIEAVTKSGTNEFHGEAFEYLRNQMFNAKNYFNTPGERIGAYKKRTVADDAHSTLKLKRLETNKSHLSACPKSRVVGYYQHSSKIRCQHSSCLPASSIEVSSINRCNIFHGLDNVPPAVAAWVYHVRSSLP